MRKKQFSQKNITGEALYNSHKELHELIDYNKSYSEKSAIRRHSNQIIN